MNHAAMLRIFLGITFSLSVGICNAQVQVQCMNNSTDAGNLNGTIQRSHVGEEIRIHGTCLVNETIVLLGDRTYEGDSRTGTIVRQAKDANLPAVLASDSWASNSAYTGAPIHIAHLTIDANSADNSGTSALVIRSWLTTIEDLLIENAPEDGIQITNLGRDNKTVLTTSQVNGRISNCFVTNSGADGIHVVDSGNSVTDWNLLDSWIASSGKSAIDMENAAGWTVRGNHIYGVQQNAIYANRCWATSIASNYIEDFGGAGGNDTYYGISCTLNGGAASVISENRVFMFTKEPSSGKYVFIGVPGVNYKVGQVNVENNTILGSGSAAETGLEFELNGGSGLNLLSSGNNVQSVHTARTIGPGIKQVTEY